MAFTFNWSPLTADASFCAKAQELLTTALNKSPKPPIIVDDILVNELNLGSNPPDLEILEIGDLAEDRFRGIFKMCYSGDAFLTLKTKVQANPLNTYLSATPSFSSIQPLAASSGLTIPLQITLSDIRLSAFIILVFSKQKGITLVFRNDPLESLKVSSTFDSIPFVREYLQKEIEAQLRTLIMEELPAIIHRLSLRIWVADYKDSIDQSLTTTDSTDSGDIAINPLSAFGHDIATSHDSPRNPSSFLSAPLDHLGGELLPQFSRRNFEQLAALKSSQRTLSLMTPYIPEAVFRAWVGSTERGDAPGLNTPQSSSLSRSHSILGNLSTSYRFPPPMGATPGQRIGEVISLVDGQPTVGEHASRSKMPRGRRRRNRIVNLRRSKSSSDVSSVYTDETSTEASATTFSATSEAAASERIEEDDEELVTPPTSPRTKIRWSPGIESIDLEPSPTKQSMSSPQNAGLQSRLAEQDTLHAKAKSKDALLTLSDKHLSPSREHCRFEIPAKSTSVHSSGVSGPNNKWTTRMPLNRTTSSNSILEQALLMKIVGELSHRANGNQDPFQSSMNDDHAGPPPAYGAF